MPNNLNMYSSLIYVILINFVTHVVSQPPKIFANPEYVVDDGANFTVLCKGNNRLNWTTSTSRSAHLKWNQLETNNEMSQNQSYKYASRLSIQNVSFSDTGFYICYGGKVSAYERFSWNHRYDLKEQTRGYDRIYLFVKDPSHLSVDSSQHKEKTMSAFETKTIPCRPTSRDVDVTFQDVSSPETKMIYPYGPKTGFDFTARTLNGHSYTYNYECIFTRGNLKFKQTWKITALESRSHRRFGPKVNLEDLNGGHSIMGEELRLKCSVNTNVKVKFDWITPLGLLSKVNYNRTVIRNKSNLYGELKYEVLLIKNATKDDRGNYSCVVEDSEMHKENASIILWIYDKNECILSITEDHGNSKISAEAGTHNVTWKMSVYSHPVVSSIIWLNNKNVQISNGPNGSTNNKYYTNQTKKSTRLKIQNITLEDFGNYTLIVRNRLGQKSVSVFLNVTAKPSIEFHLDPCYFVNKSANISCTAKGNPLPKVELKFKPCLDGNCSFEIMKSRLGIENFTIISQAVLATDKSGIVECHASNILDSKSITRNLFVSDVKEGFDIFGLPELDTVHFGETITLTCAASKLLYNNSVSLRHSTNGFDGDARISIRRNQTAYSNRVSVTIRNITFADGGVYSCAANHYGWKIPVYKNITLFVKAVHPIINSTNMNGNIKMESTNSTVLYCTFNGIPTPTITWFKDDSKLVEIPNHLQFKDGNQRLLLNHTEPNDEGFYRCEGSNKMGTVSRQVHLKFTNESPTKSDAWTIVTIITIAILSVCVLLAIIIVSYNVKIKSRKFKRRLRLVEFTNFEKGGLEHLNNDLGLDEQAELLPYDKKWEFPIEKLKLGKQVGSGAFGVVMKGEAKGLIEGESATTVAVKMVKKNADHTYIKALASELKIMVHLGKHLNVVNLMGACTLNIAQQELLVIVEYCRFGNLQNYLRRHRANFINQVVQKTRRINNSIDQQILERHYSSNPDLEFAALAFNSKTVPKDMEDYRGNTNYFGTTAKIDVPRVSKPPASDHERVVFSKNSLEPEWRSNYCGDYRGDVKPISTTDLLVWAFQVARGMEYLASRKVLHGDLAARNILLTDDNVVKICDFGLAKSMYSYRNDIYKRNRKRNLPLPMKWMAIESIKDYIFSAQSDVWSFGIVLWELFSLGSTPYPGMPSDERLYNKLVNGYRMESPDYAPQNIYNIMLNCWDSKPGSRPTFSRLSERLGSVLEEKVREHYIDLNSPYLVMNTKRHEDGQSDYLAMMN